MKWRRSALQETPLPHPDSRTSSPLCSLLSWRQIISVNLNRENNDTKNFKCYCKHELYIYAYHKSGSKTKQLRINNLSNCLHISTYTSIYYNIWFFENKVKKVQGKPFNMASPYTQRSWLWQTWIYTIWHCFYTGYSFSAKLAFEWKIIKDCSLHIPM